MPTRVYNNKWINAGTINTVLMIGLIGFVAWQQFQNTNAPVPQPVVIDPTPNPQPGPYIKTLRDLVSPDAAIELGDFYHAMALMLFNDKGLVEKQEPVLRTIEDFDRMHTLAMQSFQATTNITGIVAINMPIDKKLRVATGSLNPSKSLDDPATNVRQSLIAVCKQISEEFNPNMTKVSLTQIR